VQYLICAAQHSAGLWQSRGSSSMMYVRSMFNHMHIKPLSDNHFPLPCTEPAGTISMPRHLLRLTTTCRQTQR
jgi:hypothetical protein